mgnify:CR=1 FL=1
MSSCPLWFNNCYLLDSKVIEREQVYETFEEELPEKFVLNILWQLTNALTIFFTWNCMIFIVRPQEIKMVINILLKLFSQWDIMIEFLKTINKLLKFIPVVKFFTKLFGIVNQLSQCAQTYRKYGNTKY